MSSEVNPTLGEWLEQESYTLALSSGFFGYYAHAGAVDALAEQGLLPEKVSGSSSGGLVAGLLASGLEGGEISQELLELTRKDFWDPGRGMGLLRGQLMDQMLREIMPIDTFEESNVEASISVYDVRSRSTQAVKSGDLVLAIRASSAVPGLFQPVMIDGRPKLDGGIKDHPGLAGVGVEERILHHNLARGGKISKKTDMHPNLQTISGAELPRVTPFNLGKGVKAFQKAKENTKHSLDLPITRQD